MLHWLNNTLLNRGINVLNQKSELTKVFEEKKLKKRTPTQPSGFDLAMQKRRETLREVSCDFSIFQMKRNVYNTCDNVICFIFNPTLLL